MNHSKEEYQYAAMQLRVIHLGLSHMLERNRKALHANMREIQPGLWIHNDFKDLNEACEWLRSLLPQNT